MNVREHPLAWRWTDAKYAVLSDSTLAQMQPVADGEAARLFAESREHDDADGLSRAQFAVEALSTADISQDTGRGWLRQCEPELSTEVVVSWDERTALRATWEVFTAHWDDFCYPSSDDVLVWPESETWVLRYHHDEEFQFGRRAPTA